MVTFLFSGACAWAAPAASIAAPSIMAAIACLTRFMLSSCRCKSEPPADLGRQRDVVAHLLGLECEIERDQVHVEAAEDARLVDALSGKARARRRHLRAHGTHANVGRKRRENLGDEQVHGGGG